MGTTILDAERSRRRGSRREYRVHVSDKKNPPLAGPDEARDDVVTDGRFGGKYLDSGAEFLQFFGRDCADLFEALFVAGARIDVDQPLPQLEHVILVMLRPFDDLLVRFGAGALAGNGESNDRQRGRCNQAPRIWTLCKRESHLVLRWAPGPYRTPRHHTGLTRIRSGACCGTGIRLR